MNWWTRRGTAPRVQNTFLFASYSNIVTITYIYAKINFLITPNKIATVGIINNNNEKKKILVKIIFNMILTENQLLNDLRFFTYSSLLYYICIFNH